jgi:hypothetical protein
MRSALAYLRTEVDVRRLPKERLGLDRVEGRVEAISPYLHALLIGHVWVGGHLSSDVIRIAAKRGDP